MERTWTSIGAPYVEGREAQINRAIDALAWESVEGEKPMMPALAIGDAIKQLRLPKVSRVAIATTDLTYPDGDCGRAYYALYGIEANYKNGRARLYLLDRGSESIPVCSDFYPAVAA